MNRIRRFVASIAIVAMSAGVSFAFQNGISGGGGGGSTPGGVTTNIQFNNAGALDGDANLTWDTTTGQLYVKSNATTTIPLIVDSVSGQSAHLAEFKYDGTTAASIDNDGTFRIGGFTLSETKGFYMTDDGNNAFIPIYQGPMSLVGGDLADGSAEAIILKSSQALNSGDKIVSIKRQNTEVASFGYDGLFTANGGVSIGGSNKELRFYEGANYVGFEAPALSADQIWVLPDADGAVGQVLSTNGGGTLSWIDKTGTGATTLIGLTDTPAAYAGSANKFVRVNGAENAVVFDDLDVASAIAPGIVSTGAQAFAGAKTFDSIVLTGLNGWLKATAGVVGTGTIALASDVSGVLPIANGGTSAASKTAAFDALSPATNTGDTVYFDGTNNVRLGIGASNDIYTVSGGVAAWSPTVSVISATVGGTGLIVGTSTPFSDTAGDLTLQNVDALDATTETTVEAAIDSLSNLTSIGSDVTFNSHNVSGVASLTVTSGAKVALDATPDADQSAQGLISTMTIDENATGTGACLHIDTDGNLISADYQDGSTAIPCFALATASGTGAKSVLLEGFFRYDAWDWTAGGPIYVGTGGTLTQTQPTTTDYYSQKVGYATHSDRIFFRPDWTIVTIP